MRGATTAGVCTATGGHFRVMNDPGNASIRVPAL
jgi:hypothetical protein